MIGILGGMGPLATVDFMKKIIDATPAACDQAHVPLIVHSDPGIPDRTRAITGSGASPMPALLTGLHRLTAAGAQCIAIPCNTAHHWHGELAQASPVPVLHIADCVSNALSARGTATVGLLATDGTLSAAFYQERLAASGHRCLLSDAWDQEHLVMAGIYRTKSGDVAGGGALLEQAAQHLLSRGAGTLILACTEIPFALARINSPALSHSLDATRALAAACVAWWLARQPHTESFSTATVLC